MQMNGSERIQASKEAVWAALNDVEVLKQCIPGCESLEKISETEMTAKVVLKVGPIKASFAGKVQLSELDPPNAYRISGEGSGGVAGFAKGGARVQLESEGESITVLNYTVDAQVGGKVAQLGSRLIDATAKKLAAEFFIRFAAIVAPAVSTEPTTEQKAGWFGRFSGVASVALLLALGGANWCCVLGIHHHTMSDNILASSICSSRH
jgi:carbon monoxide dehydrogenase subunit G